MIGIRDIFESLYNAMKDVCENVYLQERPSSVIERVDSYIVVSLHSTVANREIGNAGEYNFYVTTGQIEIYVRDKVSANKPNRIDINEVDELVKGVIGKFPIKDDNILATKPRITLATSDGNGFHCTIIQTRITTLV